MPAPNDYPKSSNDNVYRFHPVWDPLLRGLHWWMAVTLLTQVALGVMIMLVGEEISEAGEETLLTLHTLFGYLFGAGLITRILWLFICTTPTAGGTSTAGLRDMLPISRAKRAEFLSTIRYYLGFLKGDPPLYKAHNAFAGVIYAAFFLIASVQVVTGYLLLSEEAEEHSHDAIELASHYSESILSELHEVGFFLIIGYIVAHLTAVVVHEFVERRGLISSMVNGKKSFTDEEWKKFNDDQ